MKIGSTRGFSAAVEHINEALGELRAQRILTGDGADEHSRMTEIESLIAAAVELRAKINAVKDRETARVVEKESPKFVSRSAVPESREEIWVGTAERLVKGKRFPVTVMIRSSWLCAGERLVQNNGKISVRGSLGSLYSPPVVMIPDFDQIRAIAIHMED